MAKILCIDDHAPTLETLRWLFEADGYECLSASNAEEGRKLFNDNEVDLVVLDQSIVSEKGSALAVEFKKIRPAPILMLSGWMDVEKPDAVDVFLTKPQEPKVLLAVALGLIVKAQTNKSNTATNPN